MKKYFYALILFGISGLTKSQNLHTKALLPDQTNEQQLSSAETYLASFQNDSAIVLTGRLLAGLKASGQFDSPFGIRAQLAEANAFEQAEQREAALQKALSVQNKSHANGLWEIHARVCLLLELIYEKSGRKESSLEQLDCAWNNMRRYKLNHLYPTYAIRRSSWERIFGDKNKALFFAREAARTAPQYGLLLEEAVSHLLLYLLLPKSADQARLSHCMVAIECYRQLGDHMGTSFMFSHATTIHLQHKDLYKALAFNDSALVHINLTSDKSSDYNQRNIHNYNQRSSIYEQMGRLDSALFYERKSHQQEKVFHKATVHDKIVAIETRYQTKKRQLQIKEQQQAIQQKDTQLRYSFIIVGLVITSTMGLLLAYRKQMQVKKELLSQNMLIEEQTNQLKMMDLAKSRFFANVSHELRTPLTLLLGPVHTLLHENQLTDRQVSLLHIAQRNGKQLGQLVNDILDLGKLELGKMNVDAVPTYLVPFFRSHLAQFVSLAESMEIRYHFEVTSASEVIVLLDQVKCQQIVNNLLNNAFKFTSAGGEITVMVNLNNTQLHLHVTDTGDGIHPDDQPYLFDRYFQTTRPEKPAYGGTGIGLALCQEYVQLFGGVIEVESTPGSGSSFQIVFPVLVLSANDIRLALPLMDGVSSGTELRSFTSGESDGSQRTNNHTVLVVEDNLDVQAYIRLILHDQYHIITAVNGQEALKKLANASNVSLILSDLMMPVMDGHQLLERVKSHDATRHIPMIILTARADTRDKLRALRIGVDDYLLKPFDANELLARIDNLLANQVARQEMVVENAKYEFAHPILSQADQKWLETFEQYVQQHLEDVPLNIPDLAHQFAMSESTLLRQLKRLTGLSPLQYVQTVRLEEARRLLENHTGKTIAQIAAKVGYTDVRSFSRSFRAKFRRLPSTFRELNRNTIK